MKSLTRIILFGLMCTMANLASAQKSVKEYTDKTDKEKIKKKIVMGPGNEPMTAKGYDDGHGKNPLLTSTEQIPDTVALISLYIYDIGTSHTVKNLSITYYSLTGSGGNTIANNIHDSGVAQLKEAFKKQGIVLLTPDEFLDTQEKKDYYYKEFAPNTSKIGDVLKAMETARNDISANADHYRVFEVGAAADYLRAESLGGDLAKKLGVDGVLSITAEIMSDKRNINMNGVRMALNGPNPIPREDKKYVGQKLGTGYYEGQLYAAGSFYFDKPVPVASFEKDKIVNENFEGLGIIFEAFAEKFNEVMTESAMTAAKKYGK